MAEKSFSGDYLKSLVENYLVLSFRFNLSDFFAPVKFHGVEFQGPLWVPTRLFPNIVGSSFVLIVPCLYGAIFRFRKEHTITIQGRVSDLKHGRNKQITLGISESERERRKQSNLLTTKINFLAWLIEVHNQ